MAVIILAFVGVLLLSVGSNLGLFFFLPGIIAIIVHVMQKINKEQQLQAQQEKRAEEARAKKQAEENRKQKALQKQKDLKNKYITSPLTQDILRTIGGGESHSRPPKEILIFNNRIQGIRDGEVYTYDFATHRVPSFPFVSEAVHEISELKYVVKPQIAMAEALNILLGNSFEIYDNAKWDMERYTDVDGNPYRMTIYRSAHVKMVSKFI